MVIEVCHDSLIVGGETDSPRRIEVLPHGTLEAVLVQVVTVGREELDAMVSGVGHQNLIFAVASDVPWIIELAGL